MKWKNHKQKTVHYMRKIKLYKKLNINVLNAQMAKM